MYWQANVDSALSLNFKVSIAHGLNKRDWRHRYIKFNPQAMKVNGGQVSASICSRVNQLCHYYSNRAKKIWPSQQLICSKSYHINLLLSLLLLRITWKVLRKIIHENPSSGVGIQRWLYTQIGLRNRADWDIEFLIVLAPLRKNEWERIIDPRRNNRPGFRIELNY